VQSALVAIKLQFTTAEGRYIIITTRTGLELAVNTEAAKRLREIAIEEGAYLKSDRPIYRLSSGKMSDHYFEGKKITLSPRGAHHVAKMVLDELSGEKVDAIGGLVVGAALIASAVAAIADVEGRNLHTFIVREKPKEHGTERLIEGHLNKGWQVAVVDDVITTGTSVLKAIEAVEKADCKVVKVIAIVDRHEGGSDELRRRGYNFQAFLGLKPAGELTVEKPAAAST
jgi:orotate phosphoribosyltransferase